MIKKGISKIKRSKPCLRIRYHFSSEICEIDAKEAMQKLKELAPMPKSTAITKNEILTPKYDLTIIVPAYNAERWINQCIDSIISQQTQYSFLAVVIDDGSTDKTGKILDSYMQSNKLRIIHQENKGYSGARNTALKKIESRFVMFVDSDDYILPNAIELLLSKAYETASDIVEGNGYTFDENSRIDKIKPLGDGRYLWGGPCLKIIKSELFRNVEFPEGYLYEDTIIGCLIGNLSKKTVFIDDEIYAYRIHANSITQKHTDDLNRVDSFWIMLLMAECMENFEMDFSFESYLLTLKHILMTFRRTILLSEEIHRYIFVCTKEFLIKHYSEYLHNKNPYDLLSKSIIKNDYGQYAFVCYNGYLLTNKAYS